MKIPGYRIIYNELEFQISRRQLPPGAPLPSESELCSYYKASRTTVRKALEMLEEQSLIARKAGVGSFVADRDRPKQPTATTVHLGVELPFAAPGDMLNDVYSGPIIAGIQAAANRFNCHLTLLPREELLHSEHPFDGRIFYTIEPGRPETWQQLTTNHASPVVLLNRIIADPQIGYVAVDYRDAARRAIRRLLLNGADDVILIGGGQHYERYAPYTRTQGWRDAYREVRGEAPDELFFDLDLPLDDFETFCSRLRGCRAKVIFISGGNHLPLTLAALSRLGRRIPEDVEIVCFDNMENLAEKLDVPISFIRVPLEKIGFTAAEYFAGRVRHHRNEILRQIQQPSLVATDSRYLF